VHTEIADALMDVLPHFLDAVVDARILPLPQKQSIMALKGPGYSSTEKVLYAPYACSQVVSTYPVSIGKPFRDGDPISENYLLKFYENQSLLVITEGTTTHSHHPNEKWFVLIHSCSLSLSLSCRNQLG
jgi:hypothetical protein